jgi:hypothetical protein
MRGIIVDTTGALYAAGQRYVGPSVRLRRRKAHIRKRAAIPKRRASRT